MKTKSIFWARLALAVTIFAWSDSSSGGDAETLAVLGLSAESQNLSTQLTSLLESALSEKPNGPKLVERKLLDEIFSETELTLSGAVNPSTATEVGRITGAGFLLSGSAIPTEDKTRVFAKVIDVKSSRVSALSVDFSSDQDPKEAMVALAEKVSRVILRQSKSSRRESPSTKEKIAMIRRSLAGRDLPSIYVAVSEEHLSRSTIDPAAETELLYFLQEVGFPITAEKENADFKIEGEGFSELGGKIKGLVSCRARVEVQVQGPDGVYFVERATTGAIDLSEMIASKSALQEVGATIAEKLVPKLLSDE